MKKIISLVLAVAMILSICAVTVFADFSLSSSVTAPLTDTEKEITWEINNNGYWELHIYNNSNNSMELILYNDDSFEIRAKETFSIHSSNNKDKLKKGTYHITVKALDGEKLNGKLYYKLSSAFENLSLTAPDNIDDMSDISGAAGASHGAVLTIPTNNNPVLRFDVGERKIDSTHLIEIVETIDSQAASELEKYGIMNGDAKGNMRLHDEITRAEATALIVRLYKLYNKDVKLDSNGFTDMEGHWAYDEISYAKSAGLIDGTSETTFEPERKVTMQEFIKMVVTLLGYKERAEATGGYPNGYKNAANSLGILASRTFMTNNAYRGEVAVILSKALDVPVMKENADDDGSTSYTIMNGENGVELQTFRTMLEIK